jgi:hypothetical protein
MKLLALTIFLGAALIAGAILISGRYTLERANDLAVWRVDQLRGETRLCFIADKQKKCITVPDAPQLPDDLIAPSEVKPQ